MESARAITKILLPSRRDNLLHRPRLVNFLHEHIDRKLLLLSAPAGYGKTSLLVDFAHETSLPVCWYSLDSSDSDPKIFLEYLVASLRRQFPDFGTRVLGLLADPSLCRDVQSIVGTLVTEIYEEILGYFVIVLDDYHAVEQSVIINEIVDSLLRLFPENAHMVLASRTLPAELTLTRLAARQEIAGLGASDLSFEPEEIRQLVAANYHLELTEAQAQQLAEQSEGWITGILLTTHSLWQGLFRELVRVRDSHSHIFNYLAEEVLTQQTSELQDFLLGSSILDQLSPELCDQVLETKNAGEMLRTIQQKNLFIIRLEATELLYRYHHLFREFLSCRLRESDAGRWRALHRRAAEAYAEADRQDVAVSHFLQAEFYDEAANIIERVAKETYDKGHWETLAKWIDALPAELLRAHPELIARRAAIMAETGDPEGALRLLAQAMSIYEQQGDAVRVGALLLQQAACLRYQGQYDQAIACCEQALSVSAESSRAQQADAHRLIGTCNASQGRLDASITELKLALQFYEEAEDYTHVAWVHHDLGVACRRAGVADAQSHFQRALEYWRRANNIVGLVNTLNSIGVSYHRQGEYDRAIDTLERALSEARRSGQLRAQALTLASLADVHRDMGEYQRAQEIGQTAFELAQRINEGFLVTYTLNALGEISRLKRDYQSAEELLFQALSQAESHRSDYEIGLTKTALGILNYERGNPVIAVEYLQNATELLEQGSAKRDGARAHLHLAQTHFIQRRFREASQHLKVAAEIGKTLHEDQFVLMDGPSLLPLVKYGAEKRIGDPYYVEVLKKIRPVPASTEEESSTASESTLPRVEAFAFGVAKVTANGRTVNKSEWESVITKELFFLLLAHPQGLRKEQILGMLWSNTDVSRASAVFHSTVYRIRRALFPECLIYNDGLYRLNPEVELWYDVAQFKRLIDQAENAQAEQDRIPLYEQAISLYKADFFEESYHDWSLPIRSELLEDYIGALWKLANLKSAVDSQAALNLCRLILERDSYREDAYQLVIKLHIAMGNRSAALRAHEECLKVMREANLTPSEETLALYDEISKGAETT